MQTKSKIAVGLLCLWQFLSIVSIANLNTRTIELQNTLITQYAHSLYLKAGINTMRAADAGVPQVELNKLEAEEELALKDLNRKLAGDFSN